MLNERINRLEIQNREMQARLARQQRRTTFALLALGAIAALGVLTAARSAGDPATAASEIAAKKFVLTDDDGNAVCVLTGNHQGPVLGFSDEKGKTRLRVYARKDGSAGFAIFDETGNDFAAIARSPAGKAQLLLQASGHVLLQTVSEDGVATEKR